MDSPEMRGIGRIGFQLLAKLEDLVVYGAR
jgi:hypothetical protein